MNQDKGIACVKDYRSENHKSGAGRSVGTSGSTYLVVFCGSVPPGCSRPMPGDPVFLLISVCFCADLSERVRVGGGGPISRWILEIRCI